MSEYAKLHCGDCCDILKCLPDRSVSLVLCDPPYGVTCNPVDKKLDFSKLWTEIWRVTKPDAAVVMFGQGAFTAEMIMSQRKNYRYTLVWDKKLISGHLNARRMPLRRHEDIILFARRQPVYHPQMVTGDKNHSVGKAVGRWKEAKSCSNSNYRGNRVVESKGNLKYPHSILAFQKPHPCVANHPTEKPVALLEWLICTYSDPDDVVLDFCMGSGSTGVAALILLLHQVATV